MKYIIAILCVLGASPAFSQFGKNIYESLHLNSSARITALGGNLISVQDDDVALAFANPAALNPSMNQQIHFGNQFYFAKTGINHGNLSYAFQLNQYKHWVFHGGIQYIDYGKFSRRDVYANDLGTFKAAEYALTGGASRVLTDKITLGANMKFVISQLESYNSLGLVTDIATMYKDTARQFSATLVIKNLGTQITAYHEKREPVPFEIQAGFSKRLRYLPFRFSIIATHLERWDIRYDDPNKQATVNLLGEEEKGASRSQIFIDNLFRHLVFNGEFLFGKKENFRLRVGYSHQRRKELDYENLKSMAGFSTGFGFKIKQFRVDYGIGFYTIGGNGHHLSISTNLNQFR